MASRATTSDPSRDHRERSSSGVHPQTPDTYLITFTCYGTRLHGDNPWSVDRNHNAPRSPMLEPDFGRAFAERSLMDQHSYRLDQPRRHAVLAAIVERCSQRGWDLVAAHVRPDHVHMIVTADAVAERVMNDIKSYASRYLNQRGIDTPDRKRWTRHGSTRHLYGRKNTHAAIRYVVEGQGEPMAVYVSPPIRSVPDHDD